METGTDSPKIDTLLGQVGRRARQRGCCRLTREVHDWNAGAKALYRRFGLGPWDPDPPTLFVSKPLDHGRVADRA